MLVHREYCELVDSLNVCNSTNFEGTRGVGRYWGCLSLWLFIADTKSNRTRLREHYAGSRNIPTYVYGAIFAISELESQGVNTVQGPSLCKLKDDELDSVFVRLIDELDMCDPRYSSMGRVRSSRYFGRLALWYYQSDTPANRSKLSAKYNGHRAVTRADVGLLNLLCLLERLGLRGDRFPPPAKTVMPRE